MSGTFDSVIVGNVGTVGTPGMFGTVGTLAKASRFSDEWTPGSMFSGAWKIKVYVCILSRWVYSLRFLLQCF